MQIDAALLRETPLLLLLQGMNAGPLQEDQPTVAMGSQQLVDNDNSINFQSIHAKLRTQTNDGKRFTMVLVSTRRSECWARNQLRW